MKKSDPDGDITDNGSLIRQNIVQNANVWLVVLDPHGRILEWNAAAEDMSGYTAGEVLGKNTIWKLLYPDAEYRKTITRTITRVIDTDKFFENFETVIRTKTGNPRTISWNTRAIPDEVGKPGHFVAIGIDVTVRKRLEGEYSAAAREWEATFNATSDGICILDANQRIQRCNRQMNEILNETLPGALVGRLCFEVIHETTGPIPECPFLVAKRTRQRTRSEVFERGRWFEVTADPILDSTGTFTGVVHIMRDITERKTAEDALRQSDEKFRGIFNNINDGIHIHEIEPDGRPGKFIEVNEVACRMLQYTREEMLKLGPLDLVTGYHSRPLEEIARELVSTGHAIFETEHRRKDGTVVPVEINTHVVSLQQKRVVVSTVRDITERKRAEEALSASRQLFADIISFLPDPTFVIDRDGTVIAWNRALEQLSGVAAADIIGKGNYEYSLWQYGKRRPILINLVQDPDQDYARVNYRRIIQKGHTVGAETDMIYSGKKIILSLMASPLVDAEGKIIGAIESMRDITRIKETEAELAHVNEHLETLVKERTRALEEEVIQRRTAERKVEDTLRYTRNVIEANPDLMVILDAKGILLDVNTTAEQMTGLPREKLIGTPYNLYLTGNVNAGENFARLFREGVLNDIPYDLRHADGRITPILSNTRVQRNEAGDVEYILTAAHDITQQKKDAEAIKVSLEEKIVLLREVHHRVKNNLQIIISLANLQLRQVEDPQIRQFLNETKNRVMAMSLVHEKLYQSESLSHIDLAEYLRFLSSQLFSYYSPDTGRIKLVTEIAPITIDINTAIPIGLIVNELVSNALKHAFPGDREGTITLTGGLTDHLLTLTVSDDGVGMPAGHDWKNAKSLGLRLVNILADQIDGKVTVPEVRGTMFIITVGLKP
jgi:PAS domain S-box-containing protein